MRATKRGGLVKRALMLPAVIKSFGLSVLVLLFFAGSRADAACWLRFDMKALSAVQKLTDDSSQTTYGAKYKKMVGSACGWAFKPVEVSVQVKGTWDKVTKTATENVNVKVTAVFPGTTTATYKGITSQTCKKDPWSTWEAGCRTWITPNLTLSKTQSTKGAWNTGGILWVGFDYRAPYPAVRRKIWEKLFPCSLFSACWPTTY
jgi:hypothetical protein